MYMYVRLKWSGDNYITRALPSLQSFQGRHMTRQEYSLQNTNLTHYCCPNLQQVDELCVNSEDFEHEQDENENERDDGDEVEPAAARERHVRLPHGGSDEAHDAVHLEIQ